MLVIPLPKDPQKLLDLLRGSLATDRLSAEPIVNCINRSYGRRACASNPVQMLGPCRCAQIFQARQPQASVK